VVTGAGHAPAPLQVAAAVSMAGAVALPGVQERLRQPWVDWKNSQRAVPTPLAAVLPLQRPSRRQLVGSDAATHNVAGSGSGRPAAMTVHTPPVPLQVSQVPLQAVLQQTPGEPSAR
jgi:hypothetical protein